MIPALRHAFAVSHRLFAAAGLALALAGLAPASAQLTIDINQGVFQPTPLAFSDFNGDTAEERQLGVDIAAVARGNLLSTGLFREINPAAFVERNLDINVQPRFSDWRLINADVLVNGRAVMQEDGKLRVEFRLWDVYGETELLARSYRTAPENWRRIAHKVSDDIYTRLTGETGSFDTRIVFVAEDGPKTNRRKRLAIMDQDGANPSFLTSGREMVLTPRFSPNAQAITYMTYRNNRPAVFLFDIETGRQEVLGDFSGMTFAPRFTPDGSGVIFSEARRGNTDIFRMDLRRREVTQLTDHPAIDTSPSMSPDGRQIVFNSDRGGSPQLYIMNADGSPMTCANGARDAACRITFSEGRYSTPVWSPRGDLIAFTKQLRGRFHIGVIRPNGEGERILTESYLDEAPSWSSNGRVVVFFREDRPGAGPALWSVDLTGRNLRRLPTPGDASDPAWSPPLP